MVDCSTITASPLAEGGDATNFLDSFICTYDMGFGLAIPAMLVWFTIMSMVYIRTQSTAMIIVLTLLMGAAFIQFLPAPAVNMISILLIGGGSALFILLVRKLDV